MELIEELLAKEYGRFGELDTRITEFFKDCVCWCRQHDVWVWSVFEAAFEEAEIEEVDHMHLGITGLINHPNIKAMNEAALAEKEAKGEPESEDDQVEADPQFEAACDDAAAVCVKVVDGVAAAASEDTEAKIVSAIGLCALALDDQSRLAYCLQGADARFSRVGGRNRRGITSDELYTREELVDFFDEESVVDEILAYLGRERDSDAAVGGDEVIRWMKEKHPPQSASEEDMEDGE